MNENQNKNRFTHKHALWNWTEEKRAIEQDSLCDCIVELNETAKDAERIITEETKRNRRKLFKQFFPWL